MSTHAIHEERTTGMGPTQWRRAAAWAVLTVIVALLGWFGFRAYLTPELLFQFANALHC